MLRTSSSDTGHPSGTSRSTSPTEPHGKDVLMSTKNLSQFMEIGRYHDFVVHDANGSEHRLHKIVLACHSDYFQAVFDSEFAEQTEHRIRLTFPDPRRVLSLIFRYMYSGQLDVTPEIAVPLLQQCQYYQVTELCEMLRQHIETVLLPKHVLTVLRDAVEFKMMEMVSWAGGVVAANFDSVDWEREDLCFLPFSVMLEIISSRSLTLDTEYRVYSVAAKYTQHWEKHPKYLSALADSPPVPMNEQHCFELYSHIYFEHLTVEQLEKVMENDHVPLRLLCQGLFASLRMALGKSVNTERLGRQYTRHMDTKRGRDFVWSGQSDFDENGVVYWLGTQIDEKMFKNPHVSGHVLCSMSSVQTGEPANLVSRTSRPTCTMSDTGAYICLDFGPSHFVLRPTHYTLRHGFSRDNVNLRRWQFEASNDCNVWDVLSRHDPDQSLGGQFGTHTWPVTADRWYRCFRVKVIGKFFVQVCGIEVYGNLLPRTLDAAFKVHAGC